MCRFETGEDQLLIHVLHVINNMKTNLVQKSEKPHYKITIKQICEMVEINSQHSDFIVALKGTAKLTT